MKCNFKFVKLAVRIGGFEEYSYHLLGTEKELTDKEATALAFEYKERDKFEFGDENLDSAFDCNKKIHVYLSSISTLTQAEAEILNKYL